MYVTNSVNHPQEGRRLVRPMAPTENAELELQEVLVVNVQRIALEDPKVEEAPKLGLSKESREELIPLYLRRTTETVVDD